MKKHEKPFTTRIVLPPIVVKLTNPAFQKLGWFTLSHKEQTEGAHFPHENLQTTHYHSRTDLLRCNILVFILTTKTCFAISTSTWRDLSHNAWAQLAARGPASCRGPPIELTALSVHGNTHTFLTGLLARLRESQWMTTKAHFSIFLPSHNLALLSLAFATSPLKLMLLRLFSILEHIPTYGKLSSTQSLNAMVLRSHTSKGDASKTTGRRLSFNPSHCNWLRNGSMLTKEPNN